jgi:hypothetical protein
VELTVLELVVSEVRVGTLSPPLVLTGELLLLATPLGCRRVRVALSGRQSQDAHVTWTLVNWSASHLAASGVNG